MHIHHISKKYTTHTYRHTDISYTHTHIWAHKHKLHAPTHIHIQAHTHIHLHTANTCILLTSDGFGGKQKKENDKSLGLKEESEEAGLTDRGSEFLKSVPRCQNYISLWVILLPLGHRKSEYPRLNEENEKENRDEATHGGMETMWTQLRLSLRAILY